jgi:hypothetical protein
MELVGVLRDRSQLIWSCTTEGKKLDDKVVKVLLSYAAGQLTQRQYQFVTSVFSKTLKLLDHITDPESGRLVMFDDWRAKTPKPTWKPGLAMNYEWNRFASPAQIVVSIMDENGKIVKVGGDKLRDIKGYMSKLRRQEVPVEKPSS